jgi:acetyl esterase/lipase
LLTPWVDVELAHAEVTSIEARDPMLAIAGALEAGRLYAGSLPTSHPAISPARGELRGLPPMTIFAGGRDILGPDAVAFAEKARASGCEVELRFEPEMIHAWALLGFPESRATLAEMASAVRAAIDDNY